MTDPQLIAELARLAVYMRVWSQLAERYAHKTACLMASGEVALAQGSAARYTQAMSRDAVAAARWLAVFEASRPDIDRAKKGIPAAEADAR